MKRKLGVFIFPNQSTFPIWSKWKITILSLYPINPLYEVKELFAVFAVCYNGKINMYMIADNPLKAMC